MSGSDAAQVIATATRCCIGLSTKSFGAAIRSGISGVEEHPFFTDRDGENVVCGREPSISASVSPAADRMIALLQKALTDLIDEVSRQVVLPSKVPVFMALPEFRPGFSEPDFDAVKSSLANTLVDQVQAELLSAMASGHAGALLAIGEAASCVASKRFPLVIAGGVDSYLDSDSIAWLDSEAKLAHSDARSGFAPGEAVSLLAIADPEFCIRMGIKPLATVGASAKAFEERQAASDTGLMGEALGSLVAEVTAHVSSSGNCITDIYSDINGEVSRNHDWAFALLRNSTCFRDGADYVTVAGECGELGAATGAVCASLAIDTWHSRCSHGNFALVWCGSWSGLRGGLVLDFEVSR